MSHVTYAPFVAPERTLLSIEYTVGSIQCTTYEINLSENSEPNGLNLNKRNLVSWQITAHDACKNLFEERADAIEREDTVVPFARKDWQLLTRVIPTKLPSYEIYTQEEIR